jgi:hypothetical protein
MECKTVTSRTSGMEGLLYSPPRDQDDGRTLLYLHGRGGFGTGIPGLFEYPDLPSLLRGGMDLPCRVLIPSCHVGEHWVPALIADFLDDVDGTSRSSGYDVVGYSRGGRGAYQFAAAHTQRVRTLAVIATRARPEVVPQITALPTLICHGIHDPYRPLSDARSMHELLLVAGSRCTLELIEGDHFIIGQVFASGLIFRWQRAVA